jgi:hypothetical protein
MSHLKMYRVVKAKRVAGNIWHMTLECGHEARVFYGATAPIDEHASCLYCDRAAAAVDAEARSQRTVSSTR